MNLPKHPAVTEDLVCGSCGIFQNDPSIGEKDGGSLYDIVDLRIMSDFDSGREEQMIQMFNERGRNEIQMV